MQMLDHPNVVALKHSFFSTTDKEELYLNLVLEYVPETVNRIARQYNRLNQRMPLIYVKLYTYQVFNCVSRCFQTTFEFRNLFEDSCRVSEIFLTAIFVYDMFLMQHDQDDEVLMSTVTFIFLGIYTAS